MALKLPMITSPNNNQNRTAMSRYDNTFNDRMTIGSSYRDLGQHIKKDPKRIEMQEKIL